MLGKHDSQESFRILIIRNIDTILISLKSSKINASSQKGGHKVKQKSNMILVVCNEVLSVSGMVAYF